MPPEDILLALSLHLLRIEVSSYRFCEVDIDSRMLALNLKAHCQLLF